MKILKIKQWRSNLRLLNKAFETKFIKERDKTPKTISQS